MTSVTKVGWIFGEHDLPLPQRDESCALQKTTSSPRRQPLSIHLIANRFAGKGLRFLERELNEIDDITWHVPESVEAATETLQSLRGQCERLVIAGGDGSFHLASRILGDGASPDQVVGFISTGTGSDFMRSFASGTLQTQIQTAFKGSSKPFRPGQVQSKEGFCAFTNVASLGVSAAVAHAVEGHLKKLGAFGYTVAMVQGILTYRSTPMTVHVDGKLLMEGLGYLTAVGCGRYFGGGKKITPNADPMGNLLHAVAVKDEGILATLKATRRLNEGEHINLSLCEHAVGEEIRIEGEGLRSELDGELGPHGNLTIRRGPVAFQLAVPPE